MQEKYDVILNGSLTTVTPLSFTQPFGKSRKLPFNGGEVKELPKLGGKLYVPASSIRGKLRRLARDVLMDAAGIDKLPLADFFFNTVGGIKNAKAEGDKEDKAVTAKAIRVREANPLAALFGAMAPVILPGKLMVSHAIALEAIEPDVVKHVRTDDLLRDPGVLDDVLDKDALQAYNDLKGGADARSTLKAEMDGLEKSLRKAKKAEDHAEKERIEARIAEIVELMKGEGTVQVQLPNLAYEVIPQNIKLASRFVLNGVTMREALLFFGALNRLAQKPVLCGKNNHGLGIVAGSWDVSIRPVGGALQSAGTISFEGDFLPAQAVGTVKEYLSTPIDTQGMDLRAELAR